MRINNWDEVVTRRESKNLRIAVKIRVPREAITGKKQVTKYMEYQKLGHYKIKIHLLPVSSIEK